MRETRIPTIRKRDSSLVPFDATKIEAAIFKALSAVKADDGQVATKLAEAVVERIEKHFDKDIPSVEDVQDSVEEVLMSHGHADVAKAYILYRQHRTEMRRLKKAMGVRDDLKLSVSALRVMERRYLLRDEDGQIIETPRELFRRVARTIAAVDSKFDPTADVKVLEQDFYDVMCNLEFLPNTPTLTNAGAPMGQLSACFVLPVGDSVIEIFEALKNMAIIHQSGGGTGFSFTNLRPSGDVVRSTKGVASGPVSFMKIFDTATGVMKQGGKRRGANMGILNDNHPDIVEFTMSKGEESALSNFNISVGATDQFMEAVSHGKGWPLLNPRTGKQVRSIGARDLFDMIVSSAWSSGDPGLIFLDEMNRQNPTPQLGVFEATNPCGELPLLPYESCNLGSINLAKVVSGGDIDWVKLGRIIRLAIHFLDNVIEANVFPLRIIQEITRGNRKVGLGVMGFADALLKMGIAYDSEAALDKAEMIMQFMREEARQASASLATQRGIFPNFAGSIYARPDGRRMRNATVLSIAPTGTISIIAGCSSGIEPLFALAFVRNVMDGSRLLEVNPVFEYVARNRHFYSQDLMDKIAYKGTLKGVEGVPEDVRRIFVTDWDITTDWHVRMQAVFQKYTDNSVSKTVNLPEEATPRDVQQVYLLAHKLKCKGITVYRYGTRRNQVLTRSGDRKINLVEEPSRYVTADSEYAGGCPHGTCPF